MTESAPGLSLLTMCVGVGRYPGLIGESITQNDLIIEGNLRTTYTGIETSNSLNPRYIFAGLANHAKVSLAVPRSRLDLARHGDTGDEVRSSGSKPVV